MSIATELQRIIDAKADLKTAIEAKSVTVGSIPLDEYAARVDLIEVGGGIPSDVITQLDTINGEVIGTTAYDKMDAIQSVVDDIHLAIETDGNTTLTSDQISTYPIAIENSVLHFKNSLDAIINGSSSASLQAALVATQNVNADIHDAIEAQGVTVDALFEDYPTAIAAISGGGAPETVTGITTNTLLADGLYWTYGWGFPNHSPDYATMASYLSDSSDSTSFGGSENSYVDAYIQGNLSNLSLIPLGATITNVRIYLRGARTRSDHTIKTIVGAHIGAAATITNDASYHDYHEDYAVNPNGSAPWTVASIAAIQFGATIHITNYAYPNTDFVSKIYVEITWSYQKLAQEIEATGVTVSQTSYDDGALKKGHSQIVVDNGDGTISLPNSNLMIARPMNMIDGTNGAVNAQNKAITANATNNGTISLNTHYTVGMMGGVAPVFGSNLQDYNYYNSPYYAGSYVTDPTTKAVWLSLQNYNYNSLGLTPSQSVGSTYWQLVKSHAHIYVCKTDHTTAAEPAMYDVMGGHSFIMNEECTYNDYMGSGGLYWKCTTPFTSTGMWWSDYGNFQDITAAKQATAFDASKWVEVTNMACPMALNVPLPRTVAGHCTYAHGLSFAGHSDWRLANFRELLEMFNFGKASSASSFCVDTLGLPSGTPIHSSTPLYSSPTTQNIYTDFSTMYPMSSAYNDNWAFGIYVRNIS